MPGGGAQRAPAAPSLKHVCFCADLATEGTGRALSHKLIAQLRQQARGRHAAKARGHEQPWHERSQRGRRQVWRNGGEYCTAVQGKALNRKLAVLTGSSSRSTERW